MRQVKAVLIYLCVIFGGGALLAPTLYFACESVASVAPAFKTLSEAPFHRFVNRALLIMSLVGLVPFLRVMGTMSWKELGLKPEPSRWSELSSGLRIGFLSLALLAIISVALRARFLVSHDELPVIMRHLVNAGTAAIIVSFIEELIFRGALLGGLKKAVPWPLALVFSSVVYALVHFFQRPSSPEFIQWYSGLAVLASMFKGFFEWDRLFPGFLNLTVVGLVLGLAYFRTGGLYASIGLHAGWIFWLKTYGFVTQASPDTNHSIFGTSKMIDGWMALPVLLITLAMVAKTFPRRETQP